MYQTVAQYIVSLDLGLVNQSLLERDQAESCMYYPAKLVSPRYKSTPPTARSLQISAPFPRKWNSYPYGRRCPPPAARNQSCVRSSEARGLSMGGREEDAKMLPRRLHAPCGALVEVTYRSFFSDNPLTLDFALRWREGRLLPCVQIIHMSP